MNIRSIQ